jgi:phosphatidylglycerophosphate synthase
VTPVRQALVLVGPGDERRVVAGLPHLVRLVLSLQRAGIERVVVDGAHALPRDSRITCDVGLVAEGAEIPGEERRLVVGPGTVLDPALVRAVLAAARDEAEVDVEERGAVVRVCAASGDGPGDSQPYGPPAGTLRPLADSDASLDTALLRALENHRDGYLDRLLHRRLSRPLSRILLRLGASPNVVTVAGIVLGVAGGVSIGASGTAAVVIGVLLLVLSNVLDCSDGEVARAGFAESKLGHLLDVTGDTVVHLSLLAGIARRLAADGQMPPTWAVVLLGLGVLGSFAAISWSEVNEARRHEVDAWENGVLDAVLSPLTTRDWYVFPVLFALAGRLDLLVQAAAVGANAFWPIVLVLVRRVLSRARPVA